MTVRATDVNRPEGCNSSVSSGSVNGELVAHPMSLQERFEKVCFFSNFVIQVVIGITGVQCVSHWFLQFQPAFLKQGSLSNSTTASGATLLEDVVISHTAQESRKALRDKFTKRSLTSTFRLCSAGRKCFLHVLLQ